VEVVKIDSMISDLDDV